MQVSPGSRLKCEPHTVTRSRVYMGPIPQALLREASFPDYFRQVYYSYFTLAKVRKTKCVCHSTTPVEMLTNLPDLSVCWRRIPRCCWRRRAASCQSCRPMQHFAVTEGGHVGPPLRRESLLRPGSMAADDRKDGTCRRHCVDQRSGA